MSTFLMVDLRLLNQVYQQMWYMPQYNIIYYEYKQVPVTASNSSWLDGSGISYNPVLNLKVLLTCSGQAKQYVKYSAISNKTSKDQLFHMYNSFSCEALYFG